ncbi:MAG: GNAT family N-acetyltransferase [archaeon]
MNAEKTSIDISEAKAEDFQFVSQLMNSALGPYYGGDHKAHAKRIFSTHISGGKDNIGFFSLEQKMFIIRVNGTKAGMVHIVGKRQGTYKISPIIVTPEHRGKSRLGSKLLEFVEKYARVNGARQIYCTVAKENNSALQFFIRKGYIIAGESDSHYKQGITELMLYKLLVSSEFEEKFDRPNISVLPYMDLYENQVRQILLENLPMHFKNIDSNWIDSLFEGYKRRNSKDINLKFKLIYVAVDRIGSVLGVAAATPKKGEPIKIMPFIAKNLPAFVALLTDIPFELKPYGRKLYIHITPTVDQTIALQQRGWKLDASLPAAYHEDQITQQWSMDIINENFMRLIRVKQYLLEMIRDGRKTLEVRVGYNNIKTIQPGEYIQFASRTQYQVVIVNAIRKYSSFKEMMASEDSSLIIPGYNEQEVLNRLRELYPPDKESFGVIVLDIKAVK